VPFLPSLTSNTVVCLVADGALRVSPSLSLYGNNVVERNSALVEGARRTWIDPNHLLVSGYLSRYYLYANAANRPGSDELRSPSVTRIQIWRPQSPGRPVYTLVWQRRVLLNTFRYGLLYTVRFSVHHSHFRFHFREFSLCFPFPWDSHGTHGNSRIMHTSTLVYVWAFAE